MSGEVDTTTGVKEEIVNTSAIIDSSETGTVVDGLAMERMDNGNVKIFAGGRYAGLARVIKGTSLGVAEAVAGDRIGLLHKGIHEAYDSEDDTLKYDQPLAATGTAGKLRIWDWTTQGAHELVGYLERTKDADKKILVRLVGGR